MVWNLSEECIFFSTPGFVASFSRNASHEKSVFIFTARMTCIVSTWNKDLFRPDIIDIGKHFSVDALLPSKYNKSIITFFILPCGTLFIFKCTHTSDHFLEGEWNWTVHFLFAIDNCVNMYIQQKRFSMECILCFFAWRFVIEVLPPLAIGKIEQHAVHLTTIVTSKLTSCINGSSTSVSCWSYTFTSLKHTLPRGRPDLSCVQRNSCICCSLYGCVVLDSTQHTIQATTGHYTHYVDSTQHTIQATTGHYTHYIKTMDILSITGGITCEGSAHSTE